jgi:hypothetical protein
MASISVSQLLVQPSENLTGKLIISVPIKCTGDAAEATVHLYIYEGSLLPTHGRPLAHYQQDVSFAKGQQRTVEFLHEEQATQEARRDVGVEVEVGGNVCVSREFDDVYYAATTGGGMEGVSAMLPMMFMVMMLGMVTQMMPKGEEG